MVHHAAKILVLIFILLFRLILRLPNLVVLVRRHCLRANLHLVLTLLSCEHRLVLLVLELLNLLLLLFTVTLESIDVGLETTVLGDQIFVLVVHAFSLSQLLLQTCDFHFELRALLCPLFQKRLLALVLS